MIHTPTTKKYNKYWSRSFVYLFVFFFILSLIISITSGYDIDLREIFLESLMISFFLWVCFPIWWLGVLYFVKSMRFIFTIIDEYIDS